MYIYNTAEAEKRDRVRVAVEHGALEAGCCYYYHYAHICTNTAEAEKRDSVGVAVEDGTLKASSAHTHTHTYIYIHVYIYVPQRPRSATV